jgi:hypothetical protein
MTPEQQAGQQGQGYQGESIQMPGGTSLACDAQLVVMQNGCAAAISAAVQSYISITYALLIEKDRAGAWGVGEQHLVSAVAEGVFMLWAQEPSSLVCAHRWISPNSRLLLSSALHAHLLQCLGTHAVACVQPHQHLANKVEQHRCEHNEQ